MVRIEKAAKDERLLQALELAWVEVRSRAGDRTAVRATLANLISALGRRQPPLSAEEIKTIVVPMLFRTHDESEEALAPPKVAKPSKPKVKNEGQLKGKGKPKKRRA